MRAWAVVVAAGSGSRFGAAKQYADLAGRPVLAWSIDAARKVCDGVALVLPPGDSGEKWGADAVAIGGATRSESVRSGLSCIPPGTPIVAIHDAARPLARPELWEAVIAAVEDGADGAIPAAPVTDTVKLMEGERLTTLDRSRLVAVQTPQAFSLPVLLAAHSGGDEATDDAALVERRGGRVVVVPGPRDNLKITDPEDLQLAAALLGASR